MNHLLLKRTNFFDVELVEQSDARDGGHGLHRQIIHNHVRNQTFHKPTSLITRRPLWLEIRSNIRNLNIHILITLRTNSLAVMAGVPVVARTHVDIGLRRRRLHIGEKQRVLGGAGDWGFGVKHGCLALVRLQIGFAEIFDAGVEVSQAADHGFLGEKLDDGADGEGEQEEEEVDELFSDFGE